MGSLEQVRSALAAGFYREVEEALRERPPEAPRAELDMLRAELYLATGRYDEAAQIASKLLGDTKRANQAAVLDAQALAARGRQQAVIALLRPFLRKQEALAAWLHLGEALRARGKQRESERAYMKLIEAYNAGSLSAAATAWVGQAAARLGAFQDANRAFQEASQADPSHAPTQLAWAELFLEKNDFANAHQSIKAALSVNPNHPRAHVLMARIRLKQSFDFEGAAAALKKAHQVNPHLVDIHVLRAGMAVMDGDVTLARQHLNRAREINSNDLEMLSTEAALELLFGSRVSFERAEREVLERNPRFSKLYTIVAGYADWEHRYPDIVVLARKGVQLDPDDADARATLGLNLLRMGEEKEGLATLRTAWNLDPYNVYVYNTLNLYDDVIPKQYVDFTQGALQFRMHREEKPVLEHYVPPLLNRGWRQMVERYGFTPEGPVRMELYADKEHFSVRTTGLPHLGVQGVCFGKVVTALSPRGGPFNWAQITWHELAHVFHIQASNNRVPRWFTEGLAEYETAMARPHWRREEDHRLWAALQSGRLPPVRLLNRAFTHASNPAQMMEAYYASAQVVTYLGERFGFDALVRMLRLWGQGRDTDRVVRDALGMDLEQLDQAFRDHVRQRLRGRKKYFRVDPERFQDLAQRRRAAQQHPGPKSVGALAVAWLVAGQPERAVSAVRRALEADPKQGLALWAAARALLAMERFDEAQGYLRRLVEEGMDGYEIRLLWARAANQARGPEQARQHLHRATRIDPERIEAWRGLLQVAEQSRDRKLEFRALERIVTIDQHDAQAHLRLMSLLAQRKQWQAVEQMGRRVMEVSPQSARAHVLLGKAYLAGDKPAKALLTLQLALQLEPERPARAHALVAQAHQALGQRVPATAAAQKALALDPSLREELSTLGIEP